MGKKTFIMGELKEPPIDIRPKRKPRTVWGLLKEYVEEFEVANKCKFTDPAWDRIKQLEQDIYRVMEKANE